VRVILMDGAISDARHATRSQGLFSNVIGYLLMAAGIHLTQSRFGTTSWHKMLFISVSMMSLLKYVPAVLIDLNVVRNQFFYAGAPLAEKLSEGMFFILSSYCAVEVAEPGSEGITFGFITTISNLTIPLASVFSSQMAAWFNLYDASGQLYDDANGRMRMLGLDSSVRCFALSCDGWVVVVVASPTEVSIVYACICARQGVGRGSSK
jgi:hypothetical protein